MSGNGEQLLVIFFLILATGFLAMARTALVAARKARLQEWISRGNRRAKLALELTGEPNRALTVLQVSIGFLVIVSGVLAGRSLVPWLFNGLFDGSGGSVEMISLGIVAVVLTCFSLILGELLPRRIASVYPETVAVLMARPLQLLTRSAWPLARFLELCTDALSRLLGRETVSAPPITEEAIKSLVQQGTEAGVFED